MINKEKLKALVSVQKELEEQKNKFSELKKQFEEQNKELIATISERQEAIAEIKEELKDEGLQEYEELEFKSKKLTGGLGIRSKTLIMYDDVLALGWAQEHKLCLKLDNKAFESIVKKNPLDFVTIKTTDSVTFPKEIKID